MRRALFVAALLGLSGCAPGNPGLVIGNVIDPDDTCLYTTSNAARTIGYLDVGIPGNSYEATFRYLNQLLNLSQAGTTGFPVMADPNVMQVEALEIEIRDIGNNPLGFTGPNPFTVPAGNILIESGDGMAAGEGLGTAQIIPAAYVAELEGVAGTNALIVVSIKAIGRTAGGAEVVSDELIYPVQLCRDCLLSCVLDEEMEPICLPSCTPGQDEVHIACEGSVCIAGTT